MKTKLKLVLSATLLSSVMGGLSPAYAQEATLLEEIVVTAQKRTQSLRDVAATVNVVSGAQLDDLNILTFEDIERVTSGVQLIRPNPRNNLISIRGVFFDPESGSSASVDVYQNGVTQRADNLFGALYDIEQVEILRGPQGSLQGATSPGGAIIINTAKPDLAKTTGYVQASYSEGNSGTNVQGAVSFPLLTDKLAVRVAAYTDQNDRGNIVNLRTGRVQDDDTTSYRASIRWKPLDNLEFNLVHQNLDQELFGTPQIVGERTEAAAFAGVPGVPCSTIALVQPGLADRCAVSLEAEDRAAFAAEDVFGNRDADITTFNLEWGISANHTLNYVYGVTDSEKVNRTENDLSSNVDLQTAFLQLGLGVINDTNFRTDQGTTTVVDADTHEIRIASNDNPVWNYMFGAYFRDQETTTDFLAFSTAARFIPLATIPVPGVTFTGGQIEGINFATGGSIPVNQENEAYFTAHSFKLNDAWTLEAALRYQEFDGFRTSDILFDSFNQPETISVQGATALGLPDTFANIVAQGVLQGTLAGISSLNIVGIPPANQVVEDDAVTGTFSVRHKVNENTNWYFSYNRSYRNPGISVNPGDDIPTSLRLYDEEEADAFELGLKQVLAGGAAEINAVLYFQDFDGYQGFVRGLDFIDSQGQLQDLTGGLVFNGDAQIYGVEVDWRYAANESWYLGGTFSYNDAEFDNALVPCNIREPGEVLGFCESSGRLPGSTEFQASLFGEYTQKIGKREFFVRGNAKYTDGIFATRAVNFGEDPGTTPSYVLADLFIGTRTDNWELTAFVKNLLDEDADIDLFNAGDPNFDVNGDFTEVNILQERSIGVLARYKF